MRCFQIPVYVGSSEGLVVKYQRINYFHGVDGFNDVHFDNQPDMSPVRTEKAVDAIRRIVQESPG